MLLSKNDIVLCYEPDPTKAKVLYDSKIMEVRVRKDGRGRRSVEYLIHFQGWSSNWDRVLPPEYVLEDTEENRQLQNRLNQEAQILKQSLKKKKKKTLAEAIKDIRQERRRCLSVPTPDRQEDESSKSSFTDGLDDTSEDEDNNEENEEDEDDEETFPLVIPEDIKKALEQDYHMITQELRLVRVPGTPSVAKIFEDYVKYFGLKELLEWSERVKRDESTQRSQASTPAAVVIPPPVVIPQVPATPPTTTLNAKLPPVPTTAVLKEEPKRDELKIVIQRINFVKEIVDGLRLMFDFLVGRILLYKQEVNQYAKSKSFVLQQTAEVPNSILTSLITKCKNEFEEDVEVEKDEPPPTKRLTRTSKALARDSVTDEVPAEPIPSSSRGRVSSSEASTTSTGKEKRSPSPDSRRRAQEYTKDLLNWKLLPSEEYDVSSPHPSLIYGIIHLMRLFVKMPEILSKTTIPRRRLRILVGHINLLLAFVAKYDGILEKRTLYYRNGEDEKAHTSTCLKG